MQIEKPTLYIIAGANGIGKTNSFYTDFPVDCPFINADEISRQLRESNPNVANIQEIANREAINLMNQYLLQKQTFGFESNLADNDTWMFIKNVQVLGYQIYLNFYSTDDLNICIQRVKQRVQEGGHDVREDIIKQRYETGLKLLKFYFNIPEMLILTDNSTSGVVCGIINNGEIISINDKLPTWVEIVLKDSDKAIKNTTLELDIDTIRSKYKSNL